MTHSFKYVMHVNVPNVNKQHCIIIMAEWILFTLSTADKAAYCQKSNGNKKSQQSHHSIFI